MQAYDTDANIYYFQRRYQIVKDNKISIRFHPGTYVDF